MSFDDTPVVQFAHPPLTAVAQPIAATTARAVEMIIAGEDGGDTPLVEPAQLVIRGSTARPRG